jgi:hypothetical protein
MTGISDAYIAEAALVAPAGVAAPKKRPFASLSTAWRRGLSAACICLIVAITAAVAWEPVRDFIGQGNHPSGRFTFYYQTESPGSKLCTALPGDTVYVDTGIQNEGKAFEASNFFARAHFVLQSDPSVVLEGEPDPLNEDAHAAMRTIKRGYRENMPFTFIIPEDAVPGMYDLVLSYKGTTQVYKGVLTVGDATGHTKFPEITTDHPFSFGYEPFLSGTITTGDELTLEAWVVNNGEHFKINGDFRPQATLCYKGETVSYTIQGELVKMGVSSTITYVESGATGRGSYAFNIPEDAPTGSYSLVLSYGGATQSFADVVTINDTPASSFSFGYEPFDGFAIPGDRFTVNAWVINEGEPFTYIGNSYKETGRFFPTVVLYHMETGYVVKGQPPETAVEAIPHEVLTGQKGEETFVFLIPADAPTGTYGLKLSYGGTQETFDNVLTVATP